MERSIHQPRGVRAALALTAEGPESRDDTPPPQSALRRVEWPLSQFIFTARPDTVAVKLLCLNFVFLF